MLQGLYVLTDSKNFSYNKWPDRVEQSILGGATIIQLRDKYLSDQELLPHALILQEICRHYDATFIINDRVCLAAKIHADGVHIGKDDKNYSTVRDYLGSGYLVGVSCYRNLYQAIHLQSLGADYVAFGSIFSSRTKLNARQCPISILPKAKQLLSIKIILYC